MTKASFGRRARREHAADFLIICKCTTCARYIIFRVHAAQAGLHDTQAQADGHAGALAEAMGALNGSRPLLVLVADAQDGLGKLLGTCDATAM